jgi:DNA-binding transcriptional LysR family regulator
MASALGDRRPAAYAAVTVPTLPLPARWDDIRVLLAVLREGSFSGAAVALAVEQSTVSRRVAALEAALGAVLFDRTPAGPRATELALRLRPAAERMEAELSALIDLSASMTEQIEGRVRLAVTSSFAVQIFLPFVLPALRTQYPALHVDLIVDERAADLVQREADLALRFFRPTEGDLLARRIAQLPTAALAHRSYAEGRPRLAAALDWIVMELGGGQTPGGAPINASFDAAYLAAHAKVTPMMFSTSHLVQIEAVRAGLGVAMLVRALRQLYPELVELELGLPPGPVIELWLVAPRTLAEVPRVRAVWDFLATGLGALEGVELTTGLASVDR